MTGISIREESATVLDEHGRIPIAFEVRRTLRVEAVAGGRYRLTECDVEVPYVKDYDSDGDPPARSVAAFDLTNWALLVARVEAVRVGGAILAFDTPHVDMLEGRRDLAVVWDLRVAPPYRDRGVGSALWRAAVGWASTRGCRQIKVETQDVNVPACRFYERQGCRLRRVVPGAYSGLPHETQLLWYADVPASWMRQAHGESARAALRVADGVADPDRPPRPRGRGRADDAAGSRRNRAPRCQVDVLRYFGHARTAFATPHSVDVVFPVSTHLSRRSSAAALSPRSHRSIPE